MKTRLLRKIRNKYHIKYSHVYREWCLDDKNYKRKALYHRSFCVIISAALHGIYSKRKADRISDMFFQRTLAPKVRVEDRVFKKKIVGMSSM